jgi:hypothetical protein
MEMMMDESETKQSALRYFDQIPVCPGCVRVLVQSGLEWHWTELPAAKIWDEFEAFEKSQLRSLRPKRYSELGCQKVSVLMMSAGGRGDSYEVCMASLWLLFRRPREKQNRHEAKAHLASLMDTYGSAWIVTVCSDLAELDTMRFHTTHGDWNPVTNDVGIDLTPIRADLGLYGGRVRQSESLH